MIVKDCRYGPMMFMENDNIIGLSFSKYGESHFHEIELLKQILRPGDMAVDVGAHIGSITVPMAQAVGSEGYVVAIEAQPHIYNTLCGNLALNYLNNVQPLNRAVAESSGKVVYMSEMDYKSSENYGGVSLASDASFKDAQGRSMQKPISTITIDDLYLANPRLIKIDVEGMEVATLVGAQKTIERSKPILYIEFMSNRDQILLALKDFGYKWCLHEPPVYNGNNFFKNPEDVLVNEEGINMVSCDVLCWHPDNPVAVESNYYIEFKTSPHPRHKEIQKIKEQIYGTQTVY